MDDTDAWTDVTDENYQPVVRPLFHHNNHLSSSLHLVFYSFDFLPFKVFNANTNSNDPITNYFDEPIQTNGIRIKPQNANDQNLALQIELLGCKHICKYAVTVC